MKGKIKNLLSVLCLALEKQLNGHEDEIAIYIPVARAWEVE